MKRCLAFFTFMTLLFLSSCCSEKLITRTITETKIQIDTIIKIVTDTVYKTKESKITDTVYIENDQAVARAFIKADKIFIQLKGKIFDVPVVINQTVKTAIKTKETKKNHNWIIWFFIGMSVTLIWINRKELLKTID